MTKYQLVILGVVPSRFAVIDRATHIVTFRSDNLTKIQDWLDVQDNQ